MVIHIPNEPWGAKELLRISQPNVSAYSSTTKHKFFFPLTRRWLSNELTTAHLTSSNYWLLVISCDQVNQLSTIIDHTQECWETFCIRDEIWPGRCELLVPTFRRMIFPVLTMAIGNTNCRMGERNNLEMDDSSLFLAMFQRTGCW